MKKILILILVVGASALVYFYFIEDSEPVENTNNPAVSENDNFRPDPSNATFIIEGENIVLSGGNNETEVAPGSTFVEETELLNETAYGDINGDGKNDAVVLLARYGGGSGTFVYVAAFISGPVNYKGTDAIFIGDRISPQRISINGGVATVEYLDRRENESFATEPTIQTSKQFVITNGKFVER